MDWGGKRPGDGSYTNAEKEINKAEMPNNDGKIVSLETF